MLRFDTEHQRARKENMVIIYGVNWNISFYDRNLDFGDYGWHRLLWPEFRDRQLWSEAATIDEIELTMSMKPLLAFFFQQERIEWWYLLVEETMVMWHVILTKRENHANEKVWKDEKTQEKKKGTR
jgi:hypothetical protein